MEKRIRAKRIANVPSHTSSSEPRAYATPPAATLSSSQSTSQLSGWSLAIFLLLLFVFSVLPMCTGGSRSNRTDGVFESATEKLDKDLPLNERETKRIDDILNFKQNKQIEEIERRHGQR